MQHFILKKLYRFHNLEKISVEIKDFDEQTIVGKTMSMFAKCTNYLSRRTAKMQ